MKNQNDNGKNTNHDAEKDKKDPQTKDDDLLAVSTSVRTGLVLSRRRRHPPRPCAPAAVSRPAAQYPAPRRRPLQSPPVAVDSGLVLQAA